MSESPREWQFYVNDMLRFCEAVLAYTTGMDEQAFIQNRLVYDATLRNLELIGEAATKIPEQMRGENPDIPWRKIIATRNRLIHGYLGIDDEILWNIISADIPVLQAQLSELGGPSA